MSSPPAGFRFTPLPDDLFPTWFISSRWGRAYYHDPWKPVRDALGVVKGAPADAIEDTAALYDPEF